jgi:hypothetical protein
MHLDSIFASFYVFKLPFLHGVQQPSNTCLMINNSNDTYNIPDKVVVRCVASHLHITAVYQTSNINFATLYKKTRQS